MIIKLKYRSMKWIKITNAIKDTPPLGERVLVFDQNFGVQIAWRMAVGGYISNSGKSDYKEITYWMPLPKIPKEIK